MLHIAFCDDDEQMLDKIEDVLKEFAAKSEERIIYKRFNSSTELESQVDMGKHFHIYILDIEMPGANGIELAQHLKASDKTAEIIFVTSYNHYGVDAVNTGVRRYIMKEDMESKLVPAIEFVADIIHKNKSEFFIIKHYNDSIRVAQEDILYILKEKNYCVIYTTDGTLHRVRDSMENVAAMLTPGRFAYTERSSLVNLECIDYTTQSDVIMVDGAHVPLSRLRRKAVQEGMAAFWRARM